MRPPGLRELPGSKMVGNLCFFRQSPDEYSVSRRQRIEEHREGIGRSSRGLRTRGPGRPRSVLQELEGKPELVGRSPCRPQLKIGGGVQRRPRGRHEGRPPSLVSRFRAQLGEHGGHSRHVTARSPQAGDELLATGSVPSSHNNGIVLVAPSRRQGRAAPAARIMSTFSRTNSSARSSRSSRFHFASGTRGNRLAFDPASSRRPVRKAARSREGVSLRGATTRYRGADLRWRLCFGRRRESDADSESDREPDHRIGHLVRMAGGESSRRTVARRSWAALVARALLDELTRLEEQRLRDRQAQRLRGS